MVGWVSEIHEAAQCACSLICYGLLYAYHRYGGHGTALHRDRIYVYICVRARACPGPLMAFLQLVTNRMVSVTFDNTTNAVTFEAGANHGVGETSVKQLICSTLGLVICNAMQACNSDQQSCHGTVTPSPSCTACSSHAVQCIPTWRTSAASRWEART